MRDNRIGIHLLVPVLALVLAASPTLATTERTPSDEPDPFLWLEEVDGEKALTWARETSAATTADLENVPEFESIHTRNLETYDSEERIPYPDRRGRFVYNFWKDAENERGLWRRTTMDGYVSDETPWETVIDIDALSLDEEKKWVWKGAECLPPEYRLCMVGLSAGGGDAVEWREFDTSTKQFVEGGFRLPLAKSSVDWKDENTLWVATDRGEGSLTTSGYARDATEWKRGTPLDDARLIFRAGVEDVGAQAYSVHTPEGRYDLVQHTVDFFRPTTFLILGDRTVKLDLPEGARVRAFFNDRFVFSLRNAWSIDDATYAAGSLLAIDLDDFLRGGRSFETLFEPADRISLGSVTRTRNELLISTLDNVRGRVYRHTLQDGKWQSHEVVVPGLGKVGIQDTSLDDDSWFMSYTDFLTPTSLYLVRDGKPEQFRALPEFFDATGMKTSQNEATSADGTKIPYFIVSPRGMKSDGSNPTLLYGYGGFEISMKPRYSATVGGAWLERGGVYVVANIRGGGEFGPAWHQAALKANRHKSFEDFIAVAEDLIARKITTPKHLGIMGGSNGGLLVGAVLTMRPDLFNAVVGAVPLLDMRRYHTLLAGASWMSEYGDPDDPEEWAFIKTWSPYHNLEKDRRYPRAMFYTSTRDDRVHPGHARKMVAKMHAMGHPVYYYENTEGGHAGATTNAQHAYSWALAYSYLWKMLR